jgi:hypothetical protein
MKKLLVVLAACLLVFGVAGQAKASFTAGDLIRVVYQTTANGGTYEVATDLGSASSILSGGALSSNTFNLFGTGTHFAGSDATTLEVAYFAVNSGKTEFWSSGTQGSTETNNGRTSWTNTIGAAALTLVNTYNSTGQTNAWAQFTTNHSTYYNLMDKNSATNTGSFDYFYKSGAADGEAQLVVGSVSQDIFDWKTPGTLTSNLAGSLTLVTTVDASGNITSSASAVPIPPSVLLLGSGLLGLIGIRRKNIFNS